MSGEAGFEHGSCDVVVAGAGPVGAASAIDLSRRGVRTVVVDPATDQPNPRANNINARTMEHLRRLGLADAVRAQGLPDDYPTDIVHLTRLGGHEIARLRLPPRSRVRDPREFYGDWPTPEPVHRVSQLFLQPVLMDALDASPNATVQLGWAFEDLSQSDDAVEVVLRRVRDGLTRRVRCAYLLGCDGGGSTVRHRLGIPLTGTARISHRVSIYFRSRSIGAQVAKDPGWMFRFYSMVNNGAMIAIDGRERFVLHSTLPDDVALDEADPLTLFEGALGPGHDLDVLSVERWTARRLVADEYARGRAFLAGDAAHVWLPTRGFGMNTGLGDAMDLSWKVAAVLGGWADPRLLDTYAVERRPVAELVSRTAELWAHDRDAIRQATDLPNLESDGEPGRIARSRLGAVLETHEFDKWKGFGLQFGYSYEHSPAVWPGGGGRTPRLVDPDRYEPTAQLGVRLPHFWIEDGISVYDRLGPWFSLVVLGDDADEPASFREQAAHRQLPLDVVRARRRDESVTALGAEAVLVRPDLHVAWAGDPDTVDAGRVLDVARGARP